MAVIAALLIGIVIGAGLGSDVVSDTRSSLEESLEGDLEEARAEADALAREAERERSYADRSYPLVVRNRLRGRRVAIVGLGDTSVATTSEIENAVNPAGVKLTAVAVLDEAPDRATLAEALRAGRGAGIGELGELLGRSIAGSGKRAADALDDAFSRTTGDLARADAVVLVRTGEAPADQLEAASEFESAFVDGLIAGGTSVVGAERFAQPDSAIAWFQSIGADTVDNVDETTGKTALVFALRGVSGDFGRKGTADRLIPDLLTVASRSGSGG